MTKGLRKDLRREIRHSFSRFLSILLISALGVAFFAGIRSASPAMRDSLDAVYDAENFMDIRVLGTLGLTKDDVAVLLSLDGVSNAEGVYTKDFLCESKDTVTVAKTMSMTSQINQFRVTEGRYPEKYNECLVDHAFLKASGYQIGDTIRLKTGTEEKIKDFLAADSFLIVGAGETAQFLSDDHGSSSIGDGTADGFVWIPKEAYTAKYYTEALVTVQGGKELNSFSKEYDKLLNQSIQNITAIATDRCNARLALFKQESDEKMTDARLQFQQQKDKATEEMSGAWQLLLDGKTELNNNRIELEQKKQQIEEVKSMLAAGDKGLPEAKNQAASLRADLNKLRAAQMQAQNLMDQHGAAIAEANKQLNEHADELTMQELVELKQRIAEEEARYQEEKQQMAAITQKIDGLAMRVEMIEALVDNYPEASKQAKTKLATLETEIAEGEKKLLDAEIELNRNEEEYNLAKEDYVAEIKAAEERLQNTEKKIRDVELPKWYVLDRTSIPSYVSYKNDTDSVAAIGTVFPVIFFLVAALVSLTTMTRMVEEERTQIGTLKALGYSKRAIASKYILYALFSTLLGAVFGVALGEGTLPYVIIHTYKLVYQNLWQIVITPQYLNAIVAIVLALFATIGGAVGASVHILTDEPAALMRPAAPQIGKRIALEDVDFIWKRLNFTQKAACRNLFRYKKRLFMTIFGVAGCMALLLVGFGVRDSVRAEPEKQFGEVFSYQGTIGADTSLSHAERRQLLAKIQSVHGVTEYLQTQSIMVYASSQTGATTANILVPQDTAKISEYVNLTPRFSSKPVSLTDDGIIITEKFAKILKVKPGDMVTIQESKTATPVGSVRVAGIVKNYLNHYIYMTPNVYKALYGESVSLNAALLKLDSDIDVAKTKESLLGINGVTSVVMHADTEQEIRDMTDNLIVIIAVMIASAGLLAFIVLYNLNNINITERKRELATLKVLGFYDRELGAYVYRENVVLTIFGILLGLVLGTLLDVFVMRTIETEFVMFSVKISWLSYLISVLLTLLFSAIVNFMMYFRLKKVDMVESLKSVE